jgi:hypothetical protein
MPGMGKAKSTNGSGKSKRPPRKGHGVQLWLHDTLARQLEKLVDRNGSDQSEELRTALRKHLANEGLWPPPPPDAED